MKTPLFFPVLLLFALPLDAADTQPSPERPQTPAIQPAAPQPGQDIPWSPPVEGYRFRLMAPKTSFQSWQTPSFTLEVLKDTTQPPLRRDDNGNPLPPRTLQQILHDPENTQTGFNFPADLPQALSDLHDIRDIPAIHIDFAPFAALKPGQSTTQTVYFIGLGPTDRLNPLRPLPTGPHSLALAQSNPITLQILPPGVKTPQELTNHLKPINAFGTPILAGFIPNKTTVVSGEPVLVTLVIQNPNKEPFNFAFGGDYRGSNRHDRFKITALDKNNKPLADPNEFPSMGGIVSNLTAPPFACVTIPVSITDFRTIPGPGTYKISCSFPLPTTYDKEHSGKIKPIPIDFTYELTVLPRTPQNIDRVVTELTEQATQTYGPNLDDLLTTLTSFAPESALPVLIKLASPSTPDPLRRIAAVKAMSVITTPASLQALLALLDDKNPAVRKQVLNSLGAFPNDAAVDALIQEFASTDAATCAAILRAMGQGKSPRALPLIIRSLDDQTDDVRLAALDAIVNYPLQDISAILRKHASSNPNLPFREAVAGALGQTLRQPIEAHWLVPVLLHYKKQDSVGDVPRLLRLYAPDDAALTLLSCLDFDNPNPRSAYNWWITYDQLVCDNSIVIPWVRIQSNQATPEQIQENARILRALKGWIAYQQKNPFKPAGRTYFDNGYDKQHEATWSPTVDDIRIRATPRLPIWPAGLPQYIRYELIQASTGHPIRLQDSPRVIEVEVDTQWYTLAPGANLLVTGDWGSGYGQRHHELQLDARWLRKSDNQPLDLKPGNHTVRVAFSQTPAEKRTALAISKPVTIQVIPTE
jgi:hypothetical protein